MENQRRIKTVSTYSQVKIIKVLKCAYTRGVQVESGLSSHKQRDDGIKPIDI